MNLSVGSALIKTRVFVQDDYDRFAKLSGDHNPIHVDPKFCETTRFGRTLAHGMFLFSTLNAAVDDLFGGTGVTVLEQELTFPGPTYTGEEMTIRLEVLAVHDGGERAEIGVTISRPDGTASLLGKSLVQRGAR